MTDPRPARPPLATAICIYEVFIAFIPLPLAWIFLFGFFHSAPIYQSVLPHSVLSWVSCALAIAGAVALWQMRRVAFFLLATRFALSMLLLMVRLPRAVASLGKSMVSLPSAVTGSTVVKVGYFLILAQWIIGALVLWYVYKVTKSEALHPLTYESQASPDLS